MAEKPKLVDWVEMDCGARCVSVSSVLLALQSRPSGVATSPLLVSCLAERPNAALIRNILHHAWQRTLTQRLSYGVFFATFDITRRVALRVKAFFGGQIQPGWDNFISIDLASDKKQSQFAGLSLIHI